MVNKSFMCKLIAGGKVLEIQSNLQYETAHNCIYYEAEIYLSQCCAISQ